MKRDSPLFNYGSRIAVGLAASGGLICAACVSGLPAITCKALARIYALELELFGTAGFCGIAILGGLAFPDIETKRWQIADTIFVCFFLLIGGASLLSGVILSGVSLQEAIDACWPIKS
jgi:hypothetical protein